MTCNTRWGDVIGTLGLILSGLAGCGQSALGGVEIAYPEDGREFCFPSQVYVGIDASSGGPAFDRWEVLADGEKVGEASGEVSEVLWFADGDYWNRLLTLRVDAYNDGVLVDSSDPVRVFFLQDVVAPIIRLVEPRPNSMHGFGCEIVITAVIDRCDASRYPALVFVNGEVYGELIWPSYSMVLGDLPVGKHEIIVRAHDSMNNHGVSAPMAIEVGPFGIADARVVEDGFRLKLCGDETERVHVLEISDDAEAWNAIATNVTSTASAEFFDGSADLSQRRFYRVVIPE